MCKTRFCRFWKKINLAILTKTYNLWFSQENTKFRCWRENTFPVLVRKHVFRFWRENAILGFGRKPHFLVLAGKHIFRFSRDNTFSGFDMKTYFFWVSVGYTFLGFGEKNMFLGFGEKRVFGFWQENVCFFGGKIVFGFSWITHFWDFGENICF